MPPPDHARPSRARRLSAPALPAALAAPLPPAAQPSEAAVRRTLSSDAVAVPPVPALTSGLADGAFVHVTGQLAYEPEAGGVAAGSGAAAQTEVVMRRIDALLRAEGLSVADLVKVTIFVTDPADIGAMRIYGALGTGRPDPG